MLFDKNMRSKGKKKSVKASNNTKKFKVSASTGKVQYTKKPVTAAESYGWVVESWEAQEAYEMAAEAWGREDINQQIVDCISDDELAACMAFIFRMSDFREWDERNNDEDDDDDEYEDED